MKNSLQDLHEVPEHLWSARKCHRSALCDALPDKEVPSVWIIHVNYMLKERTCNFHVIIREFVINFIFNTDYFFEH